MNNDSTVFSHEQIDAARKADLYSFLLTHHASLFKIEGNSIRPLSNPSVSIRKGFCGYLDFSTGCHGNSVSFLIDEMEYTFPQAVVHFFNRRPQSARCRMPRAQNCRHHSRFLLCMLENQTEHDSILCREGFRSFWLMSCSPESFCMNRQITIILSFSARTGIMRKFGELFQAESSMVAER